MSQLLLAERGVSVSCESVGRWCLKFGQSFAAKLCRRRPRPGDTWHLDEVFLRINGDQHYLWRGRRPAGGSCGKAPRLPPKTCGVLTVG